MDALRLIHDPPAAGTWNMAVDDVLLETAAGGGASYLRFYQWSAPTLSLGYFQRYADRQHHAASASLPVVRRATGGGAILHDRELTYSLVWPVSNRFAAAAELVCTVHQALRRALRRWEICATSAGTEIRRNSRDEPFLCFQRRAAEDLLVGVHKIAGSAQRRRRGAALLHGSVLLAASDYAPELPGLQDLAGSAPQVEPLAEAWAGELAAGLRTELVESRMEDSQLRQARRVERERFAADRWTWKR